MIKALKHNIDLLVINGRGLGILEKQLAHFQENAPVHKEIEFQNRLDQCRVIVEDCKTLISDKYSGEGEALELLLVDFTFKDIPKAVNIIELVIAAEHRAGKEKTSDTIASRPSVTFSDALKNSVRAEISDGGIKAALIELLLNTKDHQLHNEVILLSSNYNRLRTKKVRGEETGKWLDQEFEDFTSRLLELVDIL